MGRVVGIATRYRLDGQIFRTRAEGPRGLNNFLCIGCRVSFPGMKQPRRGADHPLHLAPRLKKEYSYTTTFSLGHHVLFYGEQSPSMLM
jgi:hypothetical protein